MCVGHQGHRPLGVVAVCELSAHDKGRGVEGGLGDGTEGQHGAAGLMSLEVAGAGRGGRAGKGSKGHGRQDGRGGGRETHAWS